MPPALTPMRLRLCAPARPPLPCTCHAPTPPAHSHAGPAPQPLGTLPTLLRQPAVRQASLTWGREVSLSLAASAALMPSGMKGHRSLPHSPSRVEELFGAALGCVVAGTFTTVV